jgi:transporter family protein
MWLILATGSAFFAGLTAILAKIGVKDTDSNLATAIRTVVILIFAWLLVFLTDAWPGWGNISFDAYLFLTLSGLATGASWLFYFKALRVGSVNKVTPVDKSSTLLSMLLAFIFLGEAFTWKSGFGMLGIGAGTYLMIAKDAADQRQSHKPEAKSFTAHVDGAADNGEGSAWLLYAVLSAVFAALVSLLSKIGLSGINSNAGTAYRTGVVLIMAWLIVTFTGKLRGLRGIDKKSWLFLCLSGVTTGLSWLCYNGALADGPASIVVPVDKLSVLLTVLFSRLFLNEKLTRRAALGLALLTAGTLALLL